MLLEISDSATRDSIFPEGQSVPEPEHASLREAAEATEAPGGGRGGGVVLSKDARSGGVSS